MISFYLKATNTPLGDITDADFKFLQDNLEEESLTDDDYTIDRMTLEYLRGNGLSQSLAQILEKALGEQDEVEIRFEQK